MAEGQRTQLGDLLTNAKGGKFLPLRGPDGAAPCWRSPDWLKIIWHPAAFGDQEARRVNVCFEPDAPTVEFFEGLEHELVNLLAAKSAQEPKAFGKTLAASDVQARVQSCLKASQRGGSFLKAKLNWDRVRFWDADGQPLESPGDLAGRLAKVRVELRQVWLMSPQCGLLLEVTDLQLREAAPECPF
ncbi:unnamed protein product [Symbiodinium necroappetens]|uniref:Uncharacterized protein n=1 Tax=Symbiodinium necroappetens TaxID=1628268 RepID=A0A813AW92_9DINO|nr:unnamed protein product [Symbiodinium necroappetens]